MGYEQQRWPSAISCPRLLLPDIRDHERAGRAVTAFVDEGSSDARVDQPAVCRQDDRQDAAELAIAFLATGSPTVDDPRDPVVAKGLVGRSRALESKRSSCSLSAQASNGGSPAYRKGRCRSSHRERVLAGIPASTGSCSGAI